MSIIITRRNAYASEPFSWDDITDWPALKYCLAFDETTGTLPTEKVSGGTYTSVLGGFTFDGNSGVADATTVLTPTFTPPDLGTNDFVAIRIGNYLANGNFFHVSGGPGGANTDRIKIAMDTTGGTNSTDIGDGAASQDMTGATEIDTNTQAVAFYSDRGDALGGGADLYVAECDGSAVSTVDSASITATGGITLDGAGKSLQVSGAITTYGYMIWKFAEVPSDINATLAWLNYQWRNGNKVLPPWWRYKT